MYPGCSTGADVLPSTTQIVVGDHLVYERGSSMCVTWFAHKIITLRIFIIWGSESLRRPRRWRNHPELGCMAPGQTPELGGQQGLVLRDLRAPLILFILYLGFSWKISFEERILWFREEKSGSRGSGPGCSFSRELPAAQGRAEPYRGHTVSVT